MIVNIVVFVLGSFVHNFPTMDYGSLCFWGERLHVFMRVYFVYESFAAFVYSLLEECANGLNYLGFDII